MTSPVPSLQDETEVPHVARSSTLQIPRNRSELSQRSASSGSLVAEEQKVRRSVDSSSEDPFHTLNRSPVLTATHDTGLRRIRQYPPPLQSSSPPHHLHSGVSSPQLSPQPSRKSSFAHTSGPASPSFTFNDDLTRFPSESLHSFSFAHQSGDSLSNRQNVLKRSIDFMRDKLSWAASSPRIASAQARLAGDEELLSMIGLLQKANMMQSEGLSVATAGLGIDRGPLTGPAHMANENVFDRSFGLPEDGSQTEQSPTSLESPAAIIEEGEEEEDALDLSSETTLAVHKSSPGEHISGPSSTSPAKLADKTVSQRPGRGSLKRTYTDVAGYSLQSKLADAMAQPYHIKETPTKVSTANAPTFRPPPSSRSGTINERAPHGHRNNQAQAIFTTESRAPWTITAANDLACLVFGVTRAEVRKLGIMEVIAESRRKWLEERLKNPESGTSPRQVPPKSRNGDGIASKPSPPTSLVSTMGNGITAKLLSKPPSKYSSLNRRSKTEIIASMPVSEPATTGAPHHVANRSRGVLLCGDVVPIRKMNGSKGSASLWVKEKGGGLIWVLEEIAEDVAFLTLDEIGSVLKGNGDVEAIWGMERVRNGMDVTRLIPAFPRLKGTNTGALDYDTVARLQHFTARTSNSISIPITIEQLSKESTFRVSSFPHIAGILVLHPATMKVSSSNSVFSSALFGYSNPNDLPITDLIPSFDAILRVMTDEDKITLEDGIVIPEHSFRRARANLALRDGSADVAAAAVFMKPSGLPARHRDGAEIMIDVQMRVVKSDGGSTYKDNSVAEDNPQHESAGEVVYALWITYSRQLHAVNHGIGPVATMLSRPGTPPHQPYPGSSSTHIDSAVPSPKVGAMTADVGDLRTHVLKDQLTDGEGLENSTSTPDAEPYEHPSPDMIAAGVVTVPKKRIDDFAILEEMGQGAYGQVKLARYRKAAAKKMVIKYVTKRRILVDTWHRDRRLGTVPLEIHVLDYLRRDGLQHPNIVEMADFFEDDINYYIEMIPHGIPGMDLFDYIELRVTMAERECRKIFCQVAQALHHLHIRAKVVHRDIKDENVILDGEGRVKLVDFGSAAYIKSGPFDVFVGTIDYAAPEVLRGLPYRGKEQDVWALGILLYTIVYKENPFYSIDEIMDHDLRVPYVMSDDCIDLIRKMLDRDVERRIDITSVLDHPWCLARDDEDEEESAEGDGARAEE